MSVTLYCCTLGRLTGFPVRCHRASLRRRSILCGTFRDASSGTGIPACPPDSPPGVTRRVALSRVPLTIPQPPFGVCELINVPQDGVRTFLPPSHLAMTKPAITRPARQYHCIARMLIPECEEWHLVRQLDFRWGDAPNSHYGNLCSRSRLKPVSIGEIIAAGHKHFRRMNQTLRIVVKDSNYPIVRFFMWVGLASATMTFIALWNSKFVLAAAGFVVLLIAQRTGAYFNGKRLARQDALRCQKCGQPVDLRQALSTTPPDDRVARCPYCREPFGKLSN